MIAGPRGLAAQRARDAHPVQPRHRDIEQQQFGRERIDEAQRLLAIGGGAHQIDARFTRAENLEAFDRERLVIDDERAERGGAHRTQLP